MQTVFSQNTKEELVTFIDNRLPSKPISTIKAYNFTVSTPYAENNNSLKEFAQKKYEDDLKNHPNVVAESERKYQEDLLKYDEEVIEARENFKLENEAWEKMTLVERMALKDQKPTLKMPRKPMYYKPSEPRYVEPDVTRAITYDPKMLSTLYLKLHGFEKGDVNALVGKIKISNFEYLEPERKSREVSYYDKASQTTKKRVEYYYETSHRRPVEMTLEHNGTEVFSGLLEGSSDYTISESSGGPNLLALEKKSVEESLINANEFINNLYGYSPFEIKREVHYVKNKSGEYDDLEKAKDFAISGYTAFKYTDKNPDLEKALEMWVKALGESDLEDKKARIDEKVTRILLINIVEAAITINDFKTADAQIKAYEKLDNNNSEKTRIGKIKAEYKDKLERFDAAKK
jgi:hypothetical protein